VFENYDDQDFRCLRIIANAKQLRIEYIAPTKINLSQTAAESTT